MESTNKNTYNTQGGLISVTDILRAINDDKVVLEPK